MTMTPEPGRLALVRRFVNTLEVDNGDDALGDPQALGAWLGEAGLLRARARVTRQDVAHARQDVAHALAIREALRVLLLANNGIRGDVGAACRVLDAAARIELRFTGQGATLRPAADGVDGALATIVGAAGEAMLDGTWPRLKACRAADCTWAFWDGARNQSRVWCSMAVCGNRTKARAFRRRRAHSTTA